MRNLIAAGISFIIMSPAFGIVAGVFLGSATALYAVTGIVALIGVVSIAAGLKEGRQLKANSDWIYGE